MQEENNKENEISEEQENSGFMSYEDLMDARKITFQDVKEHLTGPVISTVIHVVLLAFLGTIVVFKAPQKSKEITVEMKTIEPQEIEPPPPPPEPPDPVETEEVTNDIPVEAPNVDVDVDVQVDNISTDSPSEIELPNALNMKMSNSALTLNVAVGGGRRGGGSGKIGGFGYGTKADGDLAGILYDLKTTPSGKPRNVDYWGDVQSFIDNGMKVPSSNPFRQIKKKLFTSHLYIPSLPAEEGPKQFGAENEMKPSAFFVHYSGKIKVKKTFRFAGSADDMLVVLLNGKIVLDGSWDHDMNGYTPEDTKCYNSLIGWHEELGNWVEPGNYRIDILFGERPGGVIGGALLIWEKGKDYKTGIKEHPILPIFKTGRLSKEEKARILAEPWEIDPNGPVMGVGGTIKVKKEKKVTGLEIK